MSQQVGKIRIHCKINGQKKTMDVFPMERLLDVLREQVRLTGTKEGCGEGECGACSILMNDELVNSCLIPAAQADRAEITTIEGIARADQLERIQQAFVEHNGTQCGVCTPGMIMAAIYLLKQNANPTEAQIRVALAGNLCRCTGYTKIFDSVAAAVACCKKAGVPS